MASSKTTRRDLFIAAGMILAAGLLYLFSQQYFFVDRMKVKGAKFSINLNGDVTQLRLNGPQFRDWDLKFAKTVPNLISLDLTNSSVTNQGLSHLVGCRKLERLNLTSTQMTDAGLSHVSTLSHLRHLYLSETAITDDGLRHLVSLSKLEWLDINDCNRITSKGLEVLGELPSLTDIQFRNVSLTLEEFLVLRKRFPRIKFRIQTDPLSGWNESSPLKANLDVESGELRLESREEYLTAIPKNCVISEEFLDLIPGKNFVISFSHDGRFPITEEAILSLHQFPNLKTISLSNSVGPRTLHLIAGFSELEDLSLSIRDKLKPDLLSPKITDSDIASLAQLKKLRSLSLRLPNANKNAFSELRLLPELRRLSLHQNRLIDEDVIFLKDLNNLEWIRLSDNSLTDTSLEVLNKMPKLTYANLENNPISHEKNATFASMLRDRETRRFTKRRQTRDSASSLP